MEDEPQKSSASKDKSSSSQNKPSLPKDNSSSSQEQILPPPPVPQSSSSVKGHSNDTTTVVTDKDKQENMEQLDSAEQKEIEDLIDSGDSSIIKIDSLVVNPDTLDFDHNEYLCKAPDGTWHKLSKNKFITWLHRVIDFFSVLFTGRHLYDFTEVCDEMYIRPINR
jgi:hypothetical protein